MGTTLGGIAVSTAIGVLALFEFGIAWLVLLYPIVFVVSVVVWQSATDHHPILRVVLVALVNWWMLLWLGFLMVTGGGGGHATS